MHLPLAGGAAGDNKEDDLAQVPLDTFLKTLIKSNTPKRVPCQTTATQATPRPKPKIPPKPAFKVPLPHDDWEDELAAPIPSTSKSKGPVATLSKGKSPLTGTFKGKTPLTAAPTKKTRFHFIQKAGKKGKKLGKELLKLKRQTGWSEWGRKFNANWMARTTRCRRRVCAAVGCMVGGWTCKSGWPKRALSFIDRVINTWGLVPSWKNVSSVEIPASTGWIALLSSTTLTTRTLVISRTSGQPMTR